ncbi:MAG: helical backbone metal receptor [Thermoanaerobaculaceae bacterium]|nr:helical backbone metal receptor [Thermoanaerobaculaceae bacterium]
MAPDVTELAFALGAGRSVVAAPTAADFPSEVERLPRFAPSDLEAIVALRPDLVLATTAGSDPRAIARLRELGIRVFTVDVTSFDRLAAACREVGRILGRSAQGERLAAGVEACCARAGAAAAPLPRRGALYVVWWEPLIVAGPGTFHDDLLHRAALANLAPPGAGRYPRVDPELLLDPRLQVIVAADEPDLRSGFARTETAPAGARIAGGDVRVIWLPADPASRPGPRLPAALEALVAARERMERQGTGHGAQGGEGAQ